MGRSRRVVSLVTSGGIIAASLVFASVPAANAVSVTLSGVTCGATASFQVPTFVAKADDLVVSSTDPSCQGFVVPNGNSNFTGNSGSFASLGGSITLTNRKQQSALANPKTTLVELRKPGSATVITIINGTATVTTNFTAKTPPGGTVGSAYSYIFAVDGSPVEFTRSSGTLPTGLTLNTNGQLSGTPTSAGSFTFNVNAYNLSTETNALSGNVTVVIDSAALAEWTSRTPPNGVAGSSYGPYTFVASGGSESYTATGTLPSGLTLSLAGVLAGTPTQTGAFSITVTKAGQAVVSGVVSFTIASPAISKVTICHRTRATTNPYVMITVSVNSVIGSGGSNGHDDHNTTRTNKVNPTSNGITPGSGPFDTTFNYPANQKWWGDIIPPFTYGGGSYSGLNWRPSWTPPNPASGADRTRDDWLEPSEFAAAINGSGDTTSTYRLAAVQCMSIANGDPSASSSAISSPQNYFNKMVENGEDPDSISDDLNDQMALSYGNASPGSTTIPVPSVETLVTNAGPLRVRVTTNPATGVGQTTATLNGDLNTLSVGVWVERRFEWGTSRDGVRDGLGTSSDDGVSGTGPISAGLLETRLTCATTYFFRISAIDNSTPTAIRYFGIIRTFRTSNCGNGGGNGNGNGGGNGNGNGGTDTPTTSTNPTGVPPQGNRTPGAGRPVTIVVPPSTNPDGGNNPGTNQSTAAGNTPGNTQSNQEPRQITPTTMIPPPLGEQWDPQGLRLTNPTTGAPTTRIVDEQGTWLVNTNTGVVTFTPAPSFTGTAVLSVQLRARSGRIYIYPIRVVVSPNSRILVVKGDVPRDINGGVARLR